MQQKEKKFKQIQQRPKECGENLQEKSLQERIEQELNVISPLQNIQAYLEDKCKQLSTLQTYLLEELQQIEKHRCAGNKIMVVLKDLKSIISSFTTITKLNGFHQLAVNTVHILTQKFLQTIEAKDKLIASLKSQVHSLTQQFKEKGHDSSLKKSFRLSFQAGDDRSREKSKQDLNHSNPVCCSRCCLLKDQNNTQEFNRPKDKNCNSNLDDRHNNSNCKHGHSRYENINNDNSKHNNSRYSENTSSNRKKEERQNKRVNYKSPVFDQSWRKKVVKWQELEVKHQTYQFKKQKDPTCANRKEYIKQKIMKLKSSNSKAY